MGCNRSRRYSDCFSELAKTCSPRSVGLVGSRGGIWMSLNGLDRDKATTHYPSETGAVNAAVRAGADACERVGDGLVAAHIIARPHREVEPALGNGNFLGQKD
jgi:hypothetical protein